MSSAAGNFMFLCDPHKNTACSKSACHIYGGPCRYTKYMKYAKDPSKVTMFVQCGDEILGKETKHESK